MTIDMDSSLLSANGEQPSSSASDRGVQQSSETVAIPKADWEAVQKTVKRLEDETRSDKDRAVKKTNERFDKFEKEYAPVLDRVLNLMTNNNLTQADALATVKYQDEEAEQKQAIREIYQSLKGGTLQANLSSGNDGNRGGKVSEVVKEYGIVENDPEVTRIYKDYSDPRDQESAALRLALRRSTQSQPSASASTSINSAPLKMANEDAILDRVATLSKNYTHNEKEINALLAQLK